MSCTVNRFRKSGWSAPRRMTEVMLGPALIFERGPVSVPKPWASVTRSVLYATAKLSPLPLKPSPSESESARPCSRERSRMPVVPSEPALNTTRLAVMTRSAVVPPRGPLRWRQCRR